MSSFRYNFHRASSSSRGSALLSSQKSPYDGVFGGAPKMGLGNALAPRPEDYAEIFGSRTCSIPLLELPVIEGCDSRLHFDYAEVFGEYANGGNKSMTMPSFEEFLDRGDCGYDGDYHPRSTEQSGSVSDEFNRLAGSGKSPGSSHGDSLHSSDVFIESDKQTPKRTTQVGNSESSVHCSKQHETSDDGIVCNEVPGVTENERYGKFSPGWLGKIASLKRHGDEDYERVQDKRLISASDVNLRTKPSGLPPPSRAPPALTVKSRVCPQILNGKKHMAESDACRDDNVSESNWEMENANKIVETTSENAQETLGKDDTWSSITWDMEDVMKVEKGEDSVTSPSDKEREGSSMSVEKHSDLPGLHCSKDMGERFVGIVNWREETDYYEVFEGNNTTDESFETTEDFNYLTQHRNSIVRTQPNENNNKMIETFYLKRQWKITEEADEHGKIDDESFEVIPCENDILCQLPSEGQKCKERQEEASDHELYDLEYARNSKEQNFLKVSENGDALNRENGCFSPGKEAEKEVLDLHLKIEADKLEGMSNQAEEIEPIDKNGNGRESSDDIFIDFPSSEINGNYCNPSEVTQAAVLLGNQTMKVKTSNPPYESQHVIDNPLFIDRLNGPAKTVDEDGTARSVSKKTVSTKDDGEREMKTNEFVMRNSVNSSRVSVDVRKMEQSPSISEHNDGTRNIKVAAHGSNTKVNLDKERGKNLEDDYSRKLEEEREREREKEKDRMDVNTVVLEAREKLYNEKSSTEARHEAIADARERLEKASAEGRLRAERASVARATAEARQQANEKSTSEKASYNDLRGTVFLNGSRHNTYSSSEHVGTEGESPQRCKARLERYRRTAERAANALAEKNERDLLAQREKEERNRVAELLDPEVRRWANGKEGNLRALLSTLQYILGPESGWQPVPLTKIITSASVKSAYRKATLCVHPDKLQQRGATVQQKYVCEKVFDLLKESWNKFSYEERCC